MERIKLLYTINNTFYWHPIVPIYFPLLLALNLIVLHLFTTYSTCSHHVSFESKISPENFALLSTFIKTSFILAQNVCFPYDE